MVGGIASSGQTHEGLVRSRNEDSILLVPESGLWAVADGMGGHEAGDYASQCVVTHLQQACKHHSGSQLVEYLPAAIQNANHELLEFARWQSAHGIVGTTFVALILEGEHYHCYWTGDSRCYLLRDNQLLMLTEDHADEGALTHCVGVEPVAFTDYTNGYLYEGDRFFLCTDGINKVITDQQLENGLRQLHEDIDQINSRFVYDALRRGAPDNLSSIIVDV
ncbi:PP2C family protein-serine/threonine phosphatase [Oceanobacter mangrovi]|uniref:PP2C family protein-serine/threonine phosphatase n=1 Tax=Oceanobacter mangrovi TaxID=2862510 RepID=UPI001FEB7266|nr:protein phosphatase 2C domain-containing protein [Oceanobacter mangrovi]